MKKFLYFLIILLLCFKIAEVHAQTYANMPGPENVLVVYNLNSSVSDSVANYYLSARGIQESNIIGLPDLDTLAYITDPETGVEHLIELRQGEGNEKEIIYDTQGRFDPVYRHGWIYFIDRIAIPIANKLKTTNENGDTLKNVIRFIVLCKGVPFRIQITPFNTHSSCNQNVPIDGLLCFLGEDLNDPYHLMTYLNTTPASNGKCQGTYSIKNPYYNVDQNFSMDYNFIPNYFKTTAIINGQFTNITLSYLVSHLDAPGFDVVKNMIDSSVAAINSSGYDWFIDADPTPCAGGSIILNQYFTRNIFNNLGITNYFIDNSETVFTSHPKPVMSYSSNGRHTSENPNDNCDLYFQPSYIQTQLYFTYIAGSVFNTGESFNARTIGIDPLNDPSFSRDQGQIPEFFIKGGTVGVGQVFHGPGTGGIINDNSVMLPSYALGYSFIEAAYLGMTHLTATRIVVGDPLTRIYDCPEQTLTGTLNSGTYSCKIIVPEGGTLTIPSGAIVNFDRNGLFRILGTLIISENAVLNFYNKSTWECFENSNIIVEPGATINLNDKTLFSCYGSFISNGTASNFVKFNIRNFDKKMSFNNSDTINVSFTTIKKGKFYILKDLTSQIFTDIVFQDCIFDSCASPIVISDSQKLSQFKIINSQLTNNEGFGIRINGSQ